VAADGELYAGDEVAPVRPREVAAEHLPLADRRELHVRRYSFLEQIGGLFGFGEVGVGDRAAFGARLRELGEELARGGARLAHGG